MRRRHRIAKPNSSFVNNCSRPFVFMSNEMVVTSPVCEYDAPVLATHPDKPPLLRTLLILGRVSNLPTVWSNCLAGWLLAGGGAWSRFAVLGGGASLLYIGGMFLNDVCDVRFDTAHRQERPIPSGDISARAVWLLSAVLLLGGGVLLASLGQITALVTLGLVLCIVAYDLVHKRTALAPLLMAGCRFLLYLVAGSAALGGISAKLLWCAGALAAYIVGLSFIARKEAGSGTGVSPVRTEAYGRDARATKATRHNRWAVAPLLAPLAIAVILGGWEGWHLAALQGVLFLVWLALCLRDLSAEAANVGRTVSALLAGIVLVDMLAVQGAYAMTPLLFVVMGGLFASALILQRKVPAT
jgi:4-hydroxybenzoate polyprenyltransferase